MRLNKTASITHPKISLLFLFSLPFCSSFVELLYGRVYYIVNEKSITDGNEIENFAKHISENELANQRRPATQLIWVVVLFGSDCVLMISSYLWTGSSCGKMTHEY